VTAIVRLGVRVHAEQAERALAELLELVPGGLEERQVGDEVEYAVYGAPDELPERAEVRARLGGALVALTREPVPENWERRWHEFLGPIVAREGDRLLTVRPPWIEGAAEDLVIDPDVLFGAGTHATTRLCLRLLLAVPEPHGPLCDWGAGTGVLAIAAARLGWDPVAAVEVDPAAVAVIEANALANGVAVDARAGDVTTHPPAWAPTVCANLTGPLLRGLAAAGERPPERLIVSGVLGAEADEVVAAWAARGLRELRRIEEDGWAGSLLVGS
jgi:ribosomal protein L11 methyltransferase